MNVSTVFNGSEKIELVSNKRPEISEINGDTILKVKTNFQANTIEVVITVDDLTAIHEYRHGKMVDSHTLIHEIENVRNNAQLIMNEAHNLKNQVQSLKLQIALLTKEK